MSQGRYRLGEISRLIASDMSKDPEFATLTRRLEKYIEKYLHLPRQKSAGWVERKCTTVGGSEMSIIDGSNEYETERSMIVKKIGLKSSKARPVGLPAWWGNLFETILRQHVAFSYNTVIQGDDIWIETDSDSSYSPDGLGVVYFDEQSTATMVSHAHMPGTLTPPPTIQNITDVTVQRPPAPPPVNGNVVASTVASAVASTVASTVASAKPAQETSAKSPTSKVPRIVLFEFKCPYSRIPNGSVPDQYIPQVKTGLEIINIAHTSVFAEAVIRRCEWEHLGFNPKYDRTLVDKASGKNIIACGFIGFYSMRSGEMEIEYDRLEEMMRQEQYLANDTNDLGSMTKETFTRLMRLVDMKCINTWYSDTIYPDMDEAILSKELEEFTGFASPFYVWGILPWKMFRVDYHRVERTPGYLDPYREKITDLMSLVKRCKADPRNAQRMYDDYFDEKHTSAEVGYVYEERFIG